jgi:DNA-binding IclR family transcriptional regulator
MSRVCVAELPSAQPLSFRRGVGYRESLALGASGKVILAHLPANEAGGLRVEAKKRARELAQIRERGFAVSKSELIAGAVAVSLFNGSGEVIGSVSVLGPSVRLSDARISTFARLLIREAGEISQVLGRAATTGRRQA